MTTEPIADLPDPEDPQGILADLPENEREGFLAAYREHAEAAREPAGWKAFHRYLRRMRYHANATKDPGYWEALEEALAGTDSGMLLDDYVRLRRGE